MNCLFGESFELVTNSCMVMVAVPAGHPSLVFAIIVYLSGIVDNYFDGGSPNCFCVG